MSFAILFLSEPVGDGDKERGRTADGREGTGDDADEHHEREIARRRSAEEDERQECEYDRERRVDGARHRLVDGLPYRVFKRFSESDLFVFIEMFADAVEDDDDIVHAVAKECE